MYNFNLNLIKNSRKIELRKDEIMLLRVKQKYDIISKHFSKYHLKNNRKIPIIKLENGENLLLKNPESMYKYKEKYEIFVEELHNCNMFTSKFKEINN